MPWALRTSLARTHGEEQAVLHCWFLPTAHGAAAQQTCLGWWQMLANESDVSRRSPPLGQQKLRKSVKAAIPGHAHPHAHAHVLQLLVPFTDSWFVCETIDAAVSLFSPLGASLSI